jgi:hypothetical protein
MNEALPPKYPAVHVKTPMPANAPATLLHRGQRATLPARFDHATATYLLSLFDHQQACRLCDGENFAPITMNISPCTRRAVGFVAAVDYQQTDVGPYREWMLGIWVAPRGAPVPDLYWVNPLSLAFYGALCDAKGFMFYSPKMILTEALPTDVGVEHYGIPKELGQVTCEHAAGRIQFEVQGSTGPWIMRASVPRARGLLARWRVFWSTLRAFGIGPVARLAWKTELPITLAGSAKLCARNALSVVRVDPATRFLLWDDRDCQVEVNADAEWGQVLKRLGFAPALVCHIPNVAFVLSGPYDQVSNAVDSLSR